MSDLFTVVPDTGTLIYRHPPLLVLAATTVIQSCKRRCATFSDWFMPLYFSSPSPFPVRRNLSDSAGFRQTLAPWFSCSQLDTPLTKDGVVHAGATKDIGLGGGLTHTSNAFDQCVDTSGANSCPRGN